MHLLEALRKNPFVLAPMAGITDCAFRSFMREMGTGIVVTELISAHGIEYKSTNTLKLLAFEKMQRPVGIQLFGETPEVVAKAARFAQEYGCDFVDLNFGCPVPKVVKKGAGSAILKDLVALRNMLRAVKAAIDIPLTIKIRTGWDHDQRNAHQVVQVAYDEGVTWVAIHGRTRAQGYSGLSDWEYIADVKSQSPLPIIGNGDIHSALQANMRLKESGCDGVMIGRGCLKNPWIFQEALEILSGAPAPREKNKDFGLVFEKMRSYLERQCDEKILMIQLKKFASWFSAGYPGASQFRKSLFQATTLDQLVNIIEDYYREMKTVEQADTHQEAFLMGGHG